VDRYFNLDFSLIEIKGILKQSNHGGSSIWSCLLLSEESLVKKFTEIVKIMLKP
jgi:hypothetical protein